MFVRNYRNTMILLIAVGCCAVIFRWNPFFKNNRSRESFHSTVSNHSGSGLSKLGSETGETNWRSDDSFLSSPEDQILEPPVHDTGETAEEISNLPLLDDSKANDPFESPMEVSESAGTTQPSNTESAQSGQSDKADSLGVNDELYSSTDGIHDEELRSLLGEVAAPLNMGPSSHSQFKQNPFLEKHELTIDGKKDSAQLIARERALGESGSRSGSSNSRQPAQSNREWTANPFSQSKATLDSSADAFSANASSAKESTAIPTESDAGRPTMPAENDFLPNPNNSDIENSSELSLPAAARTQFVVQDETRPSPESTHYLAGILPVATPAPNKSSTTNPPQDSNVVGTQRPHALHGAENFVLAAEPKKGDHWKNETPIADQRGSVVEPIPSDFSPTPIDDSLPYDPYQQQDIYQNKKLNANQRPIIEWGRPWYQMGQLSPGSNILGKHNPVEPQFLVFGDVRSAVASNSQNGNSSTLMAFQTNLNFDLKITSTERFHMFMSPLSKGLESTGVLFDEDRFVNNTNANILAGYFEGDLGAMVGGATNKTLPFDLPFAVGVMPLLFQNGVWMEDQILGFAVTIPARNSPRFDISNMEFTFFAGYDKVISDAFPGDDSAGKVYGIASFLEAFNGYIEADYAFVEDRTFLDRSYHNVGVGYTRRFGRFVSNSTRAIVNLGQQPDGIAQTADGWLLLSENSLITGAPSTVVPYFNMFAGFDRPQSVARAVQAGGVLRNTGILFETDNLTGYPTLDATANETFGGAFGLNLLASDFSQQLIVETAFLNTMGNDVDRNAPGNQYGLGMRYQLPLTNALIFRTDAMYGFLDNTDDIHGFRVELRHKY